MTTTIDYTGIISEFITLFGNRVGIMTFCNAGRTAHAEGLLQYDKNEHDGHHGPYDRDPNTLTTNTRTEILAEQYTYALPLWTFPEIRNLESLITVNTLHYTVYLEGVRSLEFLQRQCNNSH